MKSIAWMWDWRVAITLVVIAFVPYIFIEWDQRTEVPPLVRRVGYTLILIYIGTSVVCFSILAAKGLIPTVRTPWQP